MDKQDLLTRVEKEKLIKSFGIGVIVGASIGCVGGVLFSEYQLADQLKTGEISSLVRITLDSLCGIVGLAYVGGIGGGLAMFSRMSYDAVNRTFRDYKIK